MTTIKLSTIKTLFARSKNMCAFPECDENIIDTSTGKVLGEICHIHAKSPDGPRYDSSQDDEYRQSAENLILLCPNHHKKIDVNVNQYDAEYLRDLKEKHENSIRERLLLPDFMLEELIRSSAEIRVELNHSKISGSNQIAGVIYNYNDAGLNIPESRKYNSPLRKCFQTDVLVSEIITEILIEAKTIGDGVMIDFCMKELAGYDKASDLPEDHFRFHQVYVSLKKIHEVRGMTNQEMGDFMESNKSFHKMDIIFGEPIQILEQNARSTNPDKGYFHNIMKNGRLFPGISNPDIPVHIYSSGSTYKDIIKSSRHYIFNKLLSTLEA